MGTVSILLLWVALNANDLQSLRDVPLSKPSWLGPLKPLPYETYIGVDPATGEEIRQDPKPSIKFDPEKIEYTAKWSVGLDKETSMVWVPSVNLDVTVAARVERHGDNYLFVYTLQNHPNSVQTMQRFILSCPSEVIRADAPEGSWSKTPSNSLWKEKWYFWMHSFPPYGIAPGSNQTGFSVTSPGWPGIVKCHARGNAPVTKIEHEPPATISGALPRHMLQDSLVGQTVGPMPIPAKTTEAINFVLNDLMECNDAASKWGWATDEAAAELKLQVDALTKAVQEDVPSNALAALADLAKAVDALEAKEIITNEVVSVYEARVDWLKAYYEGAGKP
ncbi:MAG: hypothetical protein AMXMBFR84_08270 [Candidatus Hydrogenedentota bacterium]